MTVTHHLYTRAAEQHRRNAELGVAHIAKPLRRIKQHRAEVIRTTLRVFTPEALKRVEQDEGYRFFKKAAALGMGGVVTAGARAVL